jgi:hypothetical protein
MAAPEATVRQVVELLEKAIEDRDDGAGSASLLQAALAAIAELMMAHDHDRTTLEEVMDSFQYKWASTALHGAEPGNYSPALHRVVENISVVYTA